MILIIACTKCARFKDCIVKSYNNSAITFLNMNETNNFLHLLDNMS